MRPMMLDIYQTILFDVLILTLGLIIYNVFGIKFEHKFYAYTYKGMISC